MIPLEQQVTSLEISKRLKELGVKQESLFYWFRNRPDMEHRLEYQISEPWTTKDENAFISAFTVAELGEMLPENVIEVSKISEKEEKTKVFFCHYDMEEQVNDFYGVDKYRLYVAELGRKKFEDRNEADARGKMLIYLLENKLITL